MVTLRPLSVPLQSLALRIPAVETAQAALLVDEVARAFGAAGSAGDLAPTSAGVGLAGRKEARLNRVAPLGGLGRYTIGRPLTQHVPAQHERHGVRR